MHACSALVGSFRTAFNCPERLVSHPQRLHCADQQTVLATCAAGEEDSGEEEDGGEEEEGDAALPAQQRSPAATPDATTLVPAAAAMRPAALPAAAAGPAGPSHDDFWRDLAQSVAAQVEQV